MATERIVIVVQAQGAKQASEDIGSIGSKAGEASKALGLLRSTGGALVGGILGNSIGQFVSKLSTLSDEYILFSNRVRLATHSQQEASIVMDELLKVGAQTRTSFSSIGETYDKLAQSSDDLGLTTTELIDLTRTLNEAFTAEGASASQVQASVNQIAIAFGQGSLTGRQFRTLLGNQPFLVEQLSKALGVGTDRLRQLGAQGKLSAQLLVDGFKIAAPEIQREFDSKITPTIDGAIKAYVNNFIRGSRNLGEAIKKDFSENPLFQQALQGIKDSPLAQTLKSAKNSAFGLGAELEQAAKFAEEARQAQERLNAEILKRSRAEFVNKNLDATQTQFLEALEKQQRATETLTRTKVTEGAVAAAGLIAENQLREKGIISETESNRLINVRKEAIAKADQLLKDGVIDQQEYNKEIRAGKSALDQNNDGVTKVRDGIVETAKRVAEATARLNIQSEIYQSIGGLQADYNERVAVASSLLDKNADAAGRLREYILKIGEARERAFPDADHAQKAAELAIARSQQDQRPLTEAIVKSYEEANKAARDYNFTLQAINVNLQKNAITQEQANRQRIEARATFLESRTDVLGGFERGFDKLSLEVTNFSTLAEQTVSDAFHGMEDALVSLVTTGKVDFASLVNSILADLTRLLARQALTGLLNTIFSAAGGGGGFLGAIAGGITSTGGSTYGGARAAGGSVDPGRAYQVGENGPEKFIPRVAGRIIPNTDAASPQVHITNLVDSDSILNTLTNPKAGDKFVNVIAVNKKAIKAVLAS